MPRADRRVDGEVGRLLRDGVDPPGGDARLLHRYLADRDEAAFEALVDRHGPPVLALCRRYLREPADVEDAFQAVFLVLIRKGRNLRDGDALASWLHGVAYRVAIRARSNVLKPAAREGMREGVDSAASEPLAPVDDAMETLDQELGRLPEKYRAPLVLCYLKGRTHDQAALELGWPVGTVRSRMAKARSILHERLSRRGVGALASLAMLRADFALPLVPSSLVAATVAAAAGRSVGPAAALAQGALSAMSPSPWKLLGIASASLGLTLGAIAYAAGALDGPINAVSPPPPSQEPKADAPARSVEARLSDVEQKLDRLIQLMEKSAEAPIDATLARNPSATGEGPGRTPPAPPPFDDGNLRGIEAQLVIAYRKYQIVERDLQRLLDRGSISTDKAETTREDALAPVRVLIARLRGLEDEAVAEEEERQERKEEERQREERQRAENAFREAEAALIQSGQSLEGVEKSIAEHDLTPRPDDTREMVEYKRHKQRFISAQAIVESTKSRRSKVEQAYQRSLGQTAAIRRLISWAKDHFPGLILTIDDVPAPEKK